MKAGNAAKFFVFTNLAISLDGKISTKDRELFPLGSKRDHLYMDVHRSRADAVLMGAGTLRCFKGPLKIKRKKLIGARRSGNLNSALPFITRLSRGAFATQHPVNVVLASRLEFDWNWPFFREQGIERFLFLPKSSFKKLTVRQRNDCERFFRVFTFQSLKTCAQEIIETLKRHGMRNLLLEGGGGTLFPFVQAGLIDEWNITLTPKIVGGASSPTLVDGEGFSASEIPSFKLKRLEQYGSELFLQYVKSKS